MFTASNVALMTQCCAYWVNTIKHPAAHKTLKVRSVIYVLRYRLDLGESYTPTSLIHCLLPNFTGSNTYFR